MSKRLNLGLLVAVSLMLFSPAVHSQNSTPKSPNVAKDQQDVPASDATRIDGWGRLITIPGKSEKPAPAPRRDISGTWGPEAGLGEGIQALGAKAMPSDGKPEHELPYTPAGLAALNRTKPSNGVRSVLPGETNDPVVFCDPQGLPREDLYELRTTQFVQTPMKVIMLYEFDKVWRVIWTDGRELPKDPEPRWFGYSIGKWVDDYTLVVQSTGMDERTWIDRAGRPHSSDLRVEERFHRVDRETLEFSVIIDDPKMYTKPWVALDKLRFHLQPADFDVREMMCSPSEFSEYNKAVGNPASNSDAK
jgi:hypothetical protein